MSDELQAVETALQQAATGPRSVTVDGRSATSQSVDDLLKLAAYQAGKEAAASNRPGFGIRFQKIRPPGAG